MAFTDTQTKALAAKLPERHVKTRVHNGEQRHYVEGWHVIAEANRIFGYDAWDRQTIELKSLGQTTVDYRFISTYLARVRITVRAGPVVIVREGVGTGHGRAFTAGEAHEVAMKSAETDAMKRALATFGNPFGLALYDSEQRGVRPERKRATKSEPAETRAWVLVDPDGKEAGQWAEPTAFCGALKRALRDAPGEKERMAWWQANSAVLEALRLAHPDLVTRRGLHYVDALAALCRAPGSANQAPADGTSAEETQGDTSPAPTTADPIRLRDKEHLRLVAGQPCLVCGRQPAEAHHLRFAQPRAMSRKPGDQFTVPLCRLHHRALHDAGDEQAWWRERTIDPMVEAERLWAMSRPAAKAS